MEMYKDVTRTQNSKLNQSKTRNYIPQEIDKTDEGRSDDNCSETHKSKHT
jgi:hypothetical protein